MDAVSLVGALIGAHNGPGTAAQGIPYVLPMVSPYNVPTPCIIPTPEGSGQTVHPDVVDFGPEGWNGWRFWMGVTPYPGGAAAAENPCVFVSHNGFAWDVPAGLANPIRSTPTDPLYQANSDTDLTYDPVGNRLLLMWRMYHTGGREKILISSSYDGSTWSEPVTILANEEGVSVTRILSPSLVRVAADDWRLFACGNNGEPDTMRTASDPLGPWSAPVTQTFSGGLGPYHVDVSLGADGRFWALYGGTEVAVSGDGVAWTAGPKALTGRRGFWDEGPYRATMTPHENGTHMRVWYSCMGYDDSGAQTWFTGFTLIARSHWLNL